MRETTRDANARYRSTLLGPNRRSAAQMSTSARLKEVASLLAVGLLRHWLKCSSDGREKGLDVLRTSSDVCPQPSSEGEKSL